MIIQLVSDTYGRGYLPKYQGSAVAPFFSGGCVAFRRACLDEIGPWDEELRTGEDIDVCLRAAATDWELYCEPAAQAEHWNRPTARALARQWWDYGYYHARLFAKHTPRSIEILGLSPSPRAHARYQVLYYRERAPFRAVVFLTPFAIMHGAAAVGALPVAAAAAAVYFREDLRGRLPLGRRLAYAGLRYLVNAALVGGGLAGGLQQGFLYVYGTLWRKR